MDTSDSKQKNFSWFRVLIATGVAAICIIASAISALKLYEFFTSPPSFSRLTSALPNCDRIIVEAVKGSETDISSVQGSRTLTGTEASDFDNIWRSEPFRDGPGDLCHSPIYRFRFYRGDILYSEATICFNCNNVYFINPDYPEQVFREISFNFMAPETVKFRSYLSRMFPGHDPGAANH